MAAWRIPFPGDVIRRLDILPGKPSLLAVWSQSSRVGFYELTTGQLVDAQVFDAVYADQNGTDHGESANERLRAPNDVLLPLAFVNGAALHQSLDGKQRLVQHAGGLLFDANGSAAALALAPDVRVAAVSFDRMMGLVAALDETGELHLYRQHQPIGRFDLGLKLTSEFHPALAVADGGATLFVTDGQRIVVADMDGHPRRQLTLHYHASSVICSPDGQLLVVGDSETGVIRVYDGPTLTPQYQRFATDMLLEARSASLQPWSEVPTALGALAVSNRGTLAFTLASSVCVTSVGRMRPVPQE